MIGEMKHELAQMAPSPQKTATALGLLSRTDPARWPCRSRGVHLWLATVRTFAAMEADTNLVAYADSVLTGLNPGEMITYGRYLYEYRARMLLDQGRPREAADSYDAALRLDDARDPRDPMGSAQLLGYSGEAYDAAGDHQEALCRWQRALERTREKTQKADIFRAKMHRLIAETLSQHAGGIAPCSGETGSIRLALETWAVAGWMTLFLFTLLCHHRRLAGGGYLMDPSAGAPAGSSRGRG